MSDVPAGAGVRIAAKLIDAVVAGVTSAGFTALLPVPLATLIGTGWFMLSDWGGSPGKWLFGLETVMEPGGPATLVASLKRNLLLGIPTIGRALVVSGWTQATGDEARWDRAFISLVGLGVTVSELSGLLRSGRRFGDRFGGTVVRRRERATR